MQGGALLRQNPEKLEIGRGVGQDVLEMPLPEQLVSGLTGAVPAGEAEHGELRFVHKISLPFIRFQSCILCDSLQYSVFNEHAP